MKARQDVLGHYDDTLDLTEIPRRLLGETPVLLEKGLDLANQGPDLVVDRGEGLLRGAGGPGHLSAAAGIHRDHESEEGEAGNPAPYLKHRGPLWCPARLSHSS